MAQGGSGVGLSVGDLGVCVSLPKRKAKAGWSALFVTAFLKDTDISTVKDADGD